MQIPPKSRWRVRIIDGPLGQLIRQGRPVGKCRSAHYEVSPPLIEQLIQNKAQEKPRDNSPNTTGAVDRTTHPIRSNLCFPPWPWNPHKWQRVLWSCFIVSPPALSKSSTRLAAFGNPLARAVEQFDSCGWRRDERRSESNEYWREKRTYHISPTAPMAG